MSQRESRLSRTIMDELRARGVFCFKIHGGPTMMAGLPDIVACVPCDPTHAESADIPFFGWFGMFVGFEVKNPDGGDPTAIQHHVHKRISEAYGSVFVVRSVQDAVDALKTIGAYAGAPTFD